MRYARENSLIGSACMADCDSASGMLNASMERARRACMTRPRCLETKSRCLNRTSKG